MITLTVATSNPVYDLSYEEIVDLVDNFKSLLVYEGYTLILITNWFYFDEQPVVVVTDVSLIK